MGRYLRPLADAAHERTKIADLIQVADEMAALLASSNPARDTIQTAIDRYTAVKRMIDIEAGIRLRSARMPGAQS